MAEIAKQQEDKMPEFAIKTQLLTRKAEQKERLEKAKEQMHFQKLREDEEMKDESWRRTAGTEKVKQTKKGVLGFQLTQTKQATHLVQVIWCASR